MSLKRLFKKRPQYELTIVNNIEEFKITFGNKVDIIITDYYLPDGEAEQIVEIAENTPVILLSSSPNPNIKNVFVQTLSKPLSLKDLDEALLQHQQKQCLKIDLTYIQKVAKNDNAFVQEMLQIYVQEMPQELKKLRTYVAQQNEQAAMRLIHKMKTKLRVGGFHGLIVQANYLEEKLKEQLIESLQKNIQDFIQEIEKSIKLIQESGS